MARFQFKNFYLKEIRQTYSGIILNTMVTNVTTNCFTTSRIIFLALDFLLELLLVLSLWLSFKWSNGSLLSLSCQFEILGRIRYLSAHCTLYWLTSAFERRCFKKSAEVKMAEGEDQQEETDRLCFLMYYLYLDYMFHPGLGRLVPSSGLGTRRKVRFTGPYNPFVRQLVSSGLTDCPALREAGLTHLTEMLKPPRDEMVF